MRYAEAVPFALFEMHENEMIPDINDFCKTCEYPIKNTEQRTVFRSRMRLRGQFSNVIDERKSA